MIIRPEGTGHNSPTRKTAGYNRPGSLNLSRPRVSRWQEDSAMFEMNVVGFIFLVLIFGSLMSVR